MSSVKRVICFLLVLLIAGAACSVNGQEEKYSYESAFDPAGLLLEMPILSYPMENGQVMNVVRHGERFVCSLWILQDKRPVILIFAYEEEGELLRFAFNNEKNSFELVETTDDGKAEIIELLNDARRAYERKEEQRREEEREQDGKSGNAAVG